MTVCQVSNLRKAESFFFERVTSLRRDIHVVVTTRDAAAARQLKVVTPNRFPVFFLLLCVWPRSLCSVCSITAAPRSTTAA